MTGSGTPVGHRPLRSSERPVCDAYDLSIVDLDGTVYAGHEPISGAVDVLAALRTRGHEVAFVTNNVSRTPAQVAAQLSELGVTAGPNDVVTSSQAAAGLLADMFPVGARVLVVGGRGLQDAIEAVRLVPVPSSADSPVAVAQGWTPELDWSLLAEGAYALATGLPWFVTNTDLTLPTDRGIAPGNGSFVALLASVVKRQPDVVAGKPGVALLQRTVAKFSARAPLVVGDRIDADIQGAVAAGMDSLLVLTGVSGVRDLLQAGPNARPTFVSADLGGLLEPHPSVVVEGSSYRVRGAVVTVGSRPRGGPAQIDVGPGAGASGPGGREYTVDLLRATASAAWAAHDADGVAAEATPRLLELLGAPDPDGSAEERT